MPRLGNTPAEVSDAELVPEAGGEPITIVSGLPRSGTSMMMQMLDGGGLPILSDGEREADEDNPRGYLELEGTKRLRTDHSWLADAQGHVVKVIAQLIPVLPLGFGYRVIFMERDIVEVLSSQRHMLERLGEQGQICRTTAYARFLFVKSARLPYGPMTFPLVMWPTVRRWRTLRKSLER